MVLIPRHNSDGFSINYTLNQQGRGSLSPQQASEFLLNLMFRVIIKTMLSA
ncbi:hypothetical protein PL9631_1060169 [Planktothrix paucivesiculata PCC 9631]|uniref:Uncharacterized protein n=1 Tax=Planktothrix paucivesiculata PCC 9631 TaxID=671071 RepID=A0A7Z9BIP3_9CYAN|nr:hypothetical protein PL9631_1060169 [Planktothrix paucivesiculata PCC 9631]